MDTESWARSIRDQCRVASVPFFFKQWGAWAHADNWVHFTRFKSGRARFDDNGATVEHDGDLQWTDHSVAKMIRDGKKRAGRQLDGRTWEEMPDG